MFSIVFLAISRGIAKGGDFGQRDDGHFFWPAQHRRSGVSRFTRACSIFESFALSSLMGYPVHGEGLLVGSGMPALSGYWQHGYGNGCG